jgi:16S rRNA processing protein RimM
MVVTRFKGIDGRTAAETLTGTELYVDRSLLGDQLSADEDYLHADLIGLQAIDETGLSHGRVIAVQNFGAGDILELSKHRGHSVAVPFTKAAVPHIDFSSRTLTLDSVAAGLVDDPDNDGDLVLEKPHVPPADRPRGPKNAGGNR